MGSMPQTLFEHYGNSNLRWGDLGYQGIPFIWGQGGYS